MRFRVISRIVWPRAQRKRSTKSHENPTKEDEAKERVIIVRRTQKNVLKMYVVQPLKFDLIATIGNSEMEKPEGKSGVAL